MGNAWVDAFIKDIRPLVDEAIVEYELSGFDIFYVGLWLAAFST